MIEKELKYLLTKEDYFKLKEYFEQYGENKRLMIIHTYYFDTIPYIFLPSMVFRLRYKEGDENIYLSVKANIKGRLPDEQAEELQVAKEFDYKLGNIDLINVKDKFPLKTEQLKFLGVNNETIYFIEQLKLDLNIKDDYLIFFGKTEIERLKGNLQFYNMPFELDHTKYYYKDKTFCKEDYELEIEDDNTERFASIVKNLFNQKEIKSIGSKRKIERLLQYFSNG